ncbi:unnamed protein product [Urochloa humidicola]
MTFWTKTQASFLHTSFLLLLCTSTSSAVEQEAGSLLRWKSNLSPANGSDEPSSSLLSWSSAMPMCFCSGITCSAAGHVTEISLPNAGLSGTLGVFNFTAIPALTKLKLRNNTITGAIPMNVAGLTYLDMSQNSLSGETPDTLPSMVQRMRYFNLSSNGLDGPIPWSLSRMREMRAFDVSTNNLTGAIPPDLFRNWPEMRIFHAQSNSLAGSIPQEINNTTKLQSLLLYFNSLSGQISVGMGRLAKLQSLCLSGNSLSGPIPLSVGNLTRLVFLGFF